MLSKNELINFTQLIKEWHKDSNYTEKSIEFSYYNLIDKYIINKYQNEDLVKVKYNSPYSSDGILTIVRENINYSILIEAKYDKNYHNRKDLIAVLCQAVYYLKRLENEGQLLPAIILLVSKNNTTIIRTEQVVDYLFKDYDWDKPASQAFTNAELYNSLFNNTNLYPLVYDLSISNINAYLDKIDHFCNISIFNMTKTLSYTIDDNIGAVNDYSGYALMKKFVSSEFNRDCTYNSNDNKWYEYNGKYWQKIDADLIKKQILTYLGSVNDLLLAHNNSVYYFRLAQKIININMINNIYDLLLLHQTKPIILSKNIISLNNGEYDLDTLKFCLHDKDHYVKTYYNYTYSGDNDSLFDFINRPDLKTNPLLAEWFAGKIDSSKNSILSYITMEDLYHSYNDWLVGNGHSIVSMRAFVKEFLMHPFYADSKSSYRQASRISNKLVRSAYIPVNTDNYILKKNPTHASHVVGISFIS